MDARFRIQAIKHSSAGNNTDNRAYDKEVSAFRELFYYFQELGRGTENRLGQWAHRQ